MTIINSIISAFSMYSKIPMPEIEWNRRNKRYAIAFFPLVGAVIGGLLYLIGTLLQKYLQNVNYLIAALVMALIATVLPFIITGGIHFDGFMDTVDANACMGDREKKLSVMKDSNAGAFAVMYAILYILIQFVCYFIIFYSCISEETYQYYLINISMIFTVSRIFSALLAINCRNARGEGYLAEFTRSAYKSFSVFILLGMLVALIAVSMFTASKSGIFASGGCMVIVSGFYLRFTSKNFRGVTGDTAGYFLQMAELCAVIAFTVFSIIN